MRYIIGVHSTRTQQRIIVVSAVLVIALLAIFQLSLSRTSGILPASIKQQIAFQVYVTSTDNKQWTINKESIKYDNSQGVLSYAISSASNTLYITEQNTPSQFTDIPQYYPALVSKLNEYSEVQTNLGTVALTHPTELKGIQTVVINSHGTLMFIRPQNNLTDNQWASFINSLDVIR